MLKGWTKVYLQKVVPKQDLLDCFTIHLVYDALFQCSYDVLAVLCLRNCSFFAR